MTSASVQKNSQPLKFGRDSILCETFWGKIPIIGNFSQTIMSSIEGQAQLEKLIVANIAKDAFMALEDAYRDGDRRGREYGARFAPGHRRSAGGQDKHFALNETMFVALEAHGANPTALRGNRVVVGRLGKFNVARLNVPGHKWVDLRCGKTRPQLAKINTAIERRYVQNDLFAKSDGEISEATLFILGVMDGQDENGLSQLTTVMVALPAPDLRSWLYIQPLSKILALYEAPETVVQPDNAKPVLKSVPNKKTGDDQGN